MNIQYNKCAFMVDNIHAEKKVCSVLICHREKHGGGPLWEGRIRLHNEKFSEELYSKAGCLS